MLVIAVVMTDEYVAPIGLFRHTLDLELSRDEC